MAPLHIKYFQDKQERKFWYPYWENLMLKEENFEQQHVGLGKKINPKMKKER